MAAIPASSCFGSSSGGRVKSCGACMVAMAATIFPIMVTSNDLTRNRWLVSSTIRSKPSGLKMQGQAFWSCVKSRRWGGADGRPNAYILIAAYRSLLFAESGPEPARTVIEEPNDQENAPAAVEWTGDRECSTVRSKGSWKTEGGSSQLLSGHRTDPERKLRVLPPGGDGRRRAQRRRPRERVAGRGVRSGRDSQESTTQLAVYATDGYHRKAHASSRDTDRGTIGHDPRLD